jgi:pimeloyl-ACP methyl ester carboxylesterase
LQVLKGKSGLTGETPLVGMAFGGLLVLKAASRIPDLKAVVSINGFFDLGGLWDNFPQVYRDNMTFALGGKDPRTAAQAFTLRGDAPLAIPALILHGGRDKIFPPSEAEACAAHASGSAVLQIFPEGNHVCNNIPWAYRPLVADWLVDRSGLAPKTGR